MKSIWKLWKKPRKKFKKKRQMHEANNGAVVRIIYLYEIQNRLRTVFQMKPKYELCTLQFLMKKFANQNKSENQKSIVNYFTYEIQ